MRGEVPSGIPWYSVEGTLKECGASTACLDLARELFYRLPPSPLATTELGQPPALVAEKTDLQTARVQKPDPMSATSSTAFVQTMAAYRRWAGSRSYRKMAAAIGNRYVASTLSGVANRTTLPTLDLVSAYIHGCGGDSDEVDIWQEAWRRLALSETGPSDEAAE